MCEGLALIFAVPNFLPLFGVDPFINSVKASIYITMGGDSFGLYLLGHLYIFTTRLRLFCLVRYKTNHWIDTIHHEETIQRRVTTSDKTDESTTNIKNTRETKMVRWPSLVILVHIYIYSINQDWTHTGEWKHWNIAQSCQNCYCFTASKRTTIYYPHVRLVLDWLSCLF